MKNNNRPNLKMKRVDMQVSALMAIIVAVSCVAVYIFGYMLTYNDMIYSLKERVYSIHNYLDKEFDQSTFIDINSKDDMKKESYKEMKELFSNIKSATGVQYLYTAKKNEAGQLIYVIDGLPDYAEDFRNPGDLIEQEIVENLNRALSGEDILPKNIVHTSWGDIFITYLPMHDQSGEVVGAIGIEFAAGHQYKTYLMFRIIAPVIILFAGVLGTLFALMFFKRISNPHFQDIANTDYLTELKNRNAYELDIKNRCAQKSIKNVGLIIADLNGLKLINDSFGHKTGDLFIKTFAKAFKSAVGNDGVLYRIGGDEFLALINDATSNTLQSYIEKTQTDFFKLIKVTMPNATFSAGKAICSGNDFTCFEKAYKAADAEMYENKKNYYESGYLV